MIQPYKTESMYGSVLWLLDYVMYCGNVSVRFDVMSMGNDRFLWFLFFERLVRIGIYYGSEVINDEMRNVGHV